MPDVVGVRFNECGKIYDFKTDNIAIIKGDLVVVELEFGLGIAQVITDKHSIDNPPFELKKIVRIATKNDFRLSRKNKSLEREAMDFCKRRAKAMGLKMKIIDTKCVLDRKRITFYFIADGRIDFRDLVKNLANKFRTRIEMRQIGARDEAKIIGGIGICGRSICCKTFLSSFEPVSIRMARKQEITLNIGNLLGLCNKLKCCLRYEFEGDIDDIQTDDDIPIEKENISNSSEENISKILEKSKFEDISSEDNTVKD